jgi:hypothetical protein
VELALCLERTTPFVWHYSKIGLERGPSWAVHHKGQILACIGLAHCDGLFDGWFVVRPEAKGHMLALVRQIRLTLAHTPYRPIRVITETTAGARIARAVGLVPVGTTDKLEVFTDGRTFRRGQG